MDRKKELEALYNALDKLECDLRKSNEKLYDAYMRAEEYRHAVEDMIGQIAEEIHQITIEEWEAMS